MRKVRLNSCEPVVFKVGLLGHEYWDWVHQPEVGQPRFFASQLFEYCSKTPWWVVPLIWVPFFLTCACYAAAKHALRLPDVAASVLVGIVAWQFLEYLIHRMVFHAELKSYWGITFHFLFHGCHHKYPMDKERLVFPPVPASAVIFAVYKLLHAVLPACKALPLFAGMGFGYVLYDCLHYAIHYGNSLPLGILKDLKKRHIDHHYKDHSRGYGISSVLFDVIFSTYS